MSAAHMDFHRWCHANLPAAWLTGTQGMTRTQGVQHIARKAGFRHVEGSEKIHETAREFKEWWESTNAGAGHDQSLEAP